MAAKFKVKHIADSHIDDTEESLVPPLEFALVKYLDCDNGRVFDGAGYCSAVIDNTVVHYMLLTYQNSHSSKDSKFS